MPIKFDKEKKGWSAEDITEEEQRELIELGMKTLTTYLGEALYKVFHSAIEESKDEDISKH